MSIKVVVTSNSIAHDPIQEKVWTLDMEKPQLGVRKVVVLEATEVELTHIRSRFINLPDVAGGHTIWREPWAQFIYDNL